MKDETRNKIEQLRAKAEFFLDNNIKAFIKDVNDTWYFCDILVVGEVRLLVSNFAGQLKGEKSNLLWIDIESIKEYKEDVSKGGGNLNGM